ncbi:MAG: GAF domain-containing protein [Janthinobacterium lividum]
MIATPAVLLPTDESERLQSLHYYDIIHSLQEELFDELVALTASLFRLPMAYMGLVEAQKMHYKATYGLPRLPPQPRATLLCAQVIKHNQVVVYHDLAAAVQTPLDARAVQAGLAQDILFYVGAPVRMASQHAIGTLCLVGPQPREFNSTEQKVLEDIASLVSRAIAVRYFCRNNPLLGEVRWQEVQRQAREETYALGALVRYLFARYGTGVPVPEEILYPVQRRLHDLRAILHED